MPDDTPPRPHPRDIQGADELAAEAGRCETEARSLRYQAELLDAQAAILRRREALARTGSLPKVTRPSTLTGNMVTDRRLAISKGRTGKDPFATAYRTKGFTLRSLAEEVGCSHTMLSMHRAVVDGRPIPRDRADAIAALIPWPADLRHWPNGFS